MRDATTGKIVVFVSRGRDAATMAHIMLQVVPKDRLEFVNLWYYPNLEYQQKQLAAWEKFFGIQIHRHPAEEVAAIVGGKQQLRFGDVREWIRDKYAADHTPRSNELCDSRLQALNVNAQTLNI